MNLAMGSQLFGDVAVPLLWGTRAIIQDKKGLLSVIDLAGDRARLEILADSPAPDVTFTPRSDGFVILSDGEEMYLYNPKGKILEGIGVHLPTCQVLAKEIRVGTNKFSGNTIIGSGVGIVVSENGIGMGAPLPRGLAKLIV